MKKCTRCGDVVDGSGVWVKQAYATEFLLRCRACARRDYEERAPVHRKVVDDYFRRVEAEMRAEAAAATATAETQKNGETPTGLDHWTQEDPIDEPN